MKVRALVLGTLLLAACSGSETSNGSDGGTGGGTGGSGGGGAQATITGSVNASNLPAGAKIIVIWSVSSSTDHSAKFGEGTIDGSSFTVSFSGAPPADALNEWGSARVGVGYPVVVPAEFQVPDGMIANEDIAELQAQVLAVNPRQMILWRSGTVEDPAWVGSFAPDTFSCGQCVDATEGIFDGIAPLSCGELVLWPPELAENSCNWT